MAKYILTIKAEVDDDGPNGPTTDKLNIEAITETVYECLGTSGIDITIDEIRPDDSFDETIDENAICVCGHTYYRHFDSYDDMAPVGCKYCMCVTFKKDPDEP